MGSLEVQSDRLAPDPAKPSMFRPTCPMCEQPTARADVRMVRGVILGHYLCASEPAHLWTTKLLDYEVIGV